MRLLLIAGPLLLGSAGLAVLALAPKTPLEEAPVEGATDALAAALSVTVTCPGEISWPTVWFPGTDDESGARPESSETLSLTSGVLSGLEPSPAGLKLTITSGAENVVEAELVNPACADGSTSLRPLLESAWSLWTRPCDSTCEWTAREGSLVTVGTVDARAGGESFKAIATIDFEGCAGRSPDAVPGTSSTPDTSESPTTAPPDHASPGPDGDPTEGAPTAPGAGNTAMTATPEQPAAAGTAPTGKTPDPTASVACETPPPVTSTPDESTPARPSPTAAAGGAGDGTRVSIESYTARVARGDEASITIAWRADTQCEIEYRTPAGTVSRAAGLSPITLGADGRGGWVWNVSARTSPGTGTITVTCSGDQSVSAAVEIV